MRPNGCLCCSCECWRAQGVAEGHSARRTVTQISFFFNSIPDFYFFNSNLDFFFSTVTQISTQTSPYPHRPPQPNLTPTTYVIAYQHSLQDFVGSGDLPQPHPHPPLSQPHCSTHARTHGCAASGTRLEYRRLGVGFVRTCASPTSCR